MPTDSRKYIFRARPRTSSLPPPGFTLATVQRLSVFHALVLDLTDEIAYSIDTALLISHSYLIIPSERARASRAGYIRELVRLVAPCRVEERDSARKLRVPSGVFGGVWNCFAPWENAQVRAVARALQTCTWNAKSPRTLNSIVTSYPRANQIPQAPIQSPHRTTMFRDPWVAPSPSYKFYLRAGLKATHHFIKSVTPIEATAFIQQHDVTEPKMMDNIREIDGFLKAAFRLANQDRHDHQDIPLSNLHCSFYSRERWDTQPRVLPNIEDVIQETKNRYIGLTGLLYGSPT